MSGNQCVFEDVEDWERFGEEFDVFLFGGLFDGVGVASFGDDECAVDFFFFHDFVEGVHGDDADGGLV